jgi:catechol 2,3-dioxygenase-like lactoylglutathione lyase family enzyme
VRETTTPVPSVRVDHLDHLVLTVADFERSERFYEGVLGMTLEVSTTGRRALHFGRSKINLHLVGSEIAPHALHPLAGSADLCLVTSLTPSEVVHHLNELGVIYEEGPVRRQGAQGVMTSVYLRDPDGNLIEISSYEPEE